MLDTFISRKMPRIRRLAFFTLCSSLIGLILSFIFGSTICPDDCSSKKIVSYESNTANYSNELTIRNSSKSIIRPRYAADELKIKEKLFFGLMSSPETYDTLAVWHNLTAKSVVSKFMVFIPNSTFSTDLDLEVVTYDDTRSYLNPFYILKYIWENERDTYDWHFILQDNSFLRPIQLMEFISHISITNELCIAEKHPSVPGCCRLESGVIISNSLVPRILNAMNWCLEDISAKNLACSFCFCVKFATSEECTGYIREDLYFHSSSLPVSDLGIETRLKLATSKDIDKSFVVYPVDDIHSMLYLQQFFDEISLKNLETDMRQLEQEILNITNTSDWPSFLNPPFSPINRFELLKWEYFNRTHVFSCEKSEIFRKMDEAYRSDLEDVILYSKSKLKETYGTNISLNENITGYKQFDPTRGIHYQIDFESNNHECFRVEVLRPLSMPRIIADPLPSISPFHVLVPLQYDHELENAHRLNKLLKPHPISFVLLSSLNQSSTSGLKIIKASSLLEAAISFPANYMIITLNVWADPDFNSFLSRARRNTLRNLQVYVPVPFVRYHPRIAPSSKFILHKDFGWFNQYNYDYIVFHVDDIVLNNGITILDSISPQVEILRAPDPALKQLYRDIECFNSSDSVCSVEKSLSFGSRSQLALFISKAHNSSSNTSFNMNTEI